MELILLYTTVALVLLVSVLIVWIAKMSKKISNLTQGAQGVSLEHIVTENNQLISRQTELLEKQSDNIKVLQEDILSAFQNIGVIRFNPFKETGGNQSFAIALLNNKNDGVIISSLYTRERVNIFAKPITNGSSEFKLTGEEHEALNKAQNNQR